MNEFFSHNYVKINLVFVSFLRRMRRERDTQLRPSSSGKSFHEVSSSVNVRGVNSLFLCLDSCNAFRISRMVKSCPV